MTDIYKLKIAKSGYGITDTNMAHIAFDSDINSFKIRSTAITSLIVGDLALTVAHGLSYAPAFLLWFEVNGNGKWYPMYTTEDYTGKGVSVGCASDDTNLYINWGYSSAPTSLKVFYMLIVDPVE